MSIPDGFSPVHHLWIEMVKSSGIRMTPIRKSMLKSVGAVVMRVKTADEIRERYGSLDLRSVIDSVVQGHIAMGYTNPYVCSTGLGLRYTDMAATIRGLQIPIYTIGYEARVANLKLLSGLVEAVSMNASEGQIQYKLGSLLNAQM